MAFHYKVGFIGTGNMAQTIMKGLIESHIIPPQNIFAYNRTPGKLQKVTELWGIHSVNNNEEVIESSDIVILAMKPQDFAKAIDPVATIFYEKQRLSQQQQLTLHKVHFLPIFCHFANQHQLRCCRKIPYSKFHAFRLQSRDTEH